MSTRKPCEWKQAPWGVAGWLYCAVHNHGRQERQG